MRYLLPLLILISLTFGLATAQDAAPNETIEFSDHPARVVSNIGGLNVRSTPAIEADNIVGRLQPGQQVHVLAREGDWQQVRSENGLLGWSHSDYLIDLPPRQLGETRRFNYVTSSGIGRYAEAVLHYIGAHSYLYIAEDDFDMAQDLDPFRVARLGQTIDEELYPQTSALWDAPLRPSHEGDERVVILLSGGNGGYYVRTHMPGELNPYQNRTGYIEVDVPGGLIDEQHQIYVEEVIAHELQHLFGHIPVKRAIPLVGEGIATFGTLYLGYELISELIASEFLATPWTPLLEFEGELRHYGAGLLFMTYLFEQLGLEAIMTLAHHPSGTLDTLAAILADEATDWDVESFFADWVLANRLLDPQLADGRYGYRLLEALELSGASMTGRIQDLPTRIESSLAPYASAYYELDLPASGSETALELSLQFAAAHQDGWLQLAQVVDGDVSIQRFRARDYRTAPISASLQPEAEAAFLAISTLQASAQATTHPVAFTLLLHAAGSTPAATDYAAPFPLNVPVPAELQLDLSHLDENSSPLSLALGIQDIIQAYGEKRNEIFTDRNWAAITQIEEKVRQLIEYGADVSRMDYGIVTTVVSDIHTPRMLAMLLAAGANPDDQKLGGYFTIPEAPEFQFPSSALLFAVMLDDEESLQMLLDAGVNLNPIRRGLSPLHLASILGYKHFVNLLLAAGADPAIKDWSGVTAIDLARQHGQHEIAALLEARLPSN